MRPFAFRRVNMKTLVYLVHGMGQGTATGAAPTAGSEWWREPLATIADLGIPYGQTFVAIDDQTPGTASIVPLSYHQFFDTYRKTALQDQQSAFRELVGKQFTNEQVASVASDGMVWTHWLDVLLVLLTAMRGEITTNLLSQILQAEAPYRVRGATPIRRILVAHSLGSALATQLLRVWRTNVGESNQLVSHYFTLANVSSLILPSASVYDQQLIPSVSSPIIGAMTNATHKLDPIPDLLPWRSFSPLKFQSSSRDGWRQARQFNDYLDPLVVDVRGPNVAALSVFDVHGFSNYLRWPEVSFRLFSAIQDRVFSPSGREATLALERYHSLGQLSCISLVEQLRDRIKEPARPEDSPRDGELRALVHQMVRTTSAMNDLARECAS
jgi:hypothetical protein